MNWFYLNLALAAAGLAWPATAAETAVQATRSALEKWVETRQLISKERAAWQADQELLDQTASLYQRELAGLEDQLSKISTNNVQVEKERMEAETAKAAAETMLAETRTFAAALEAKVKSSLARLPAPLQESLQPFLRRLPENAETRMVPTERMQVLVGILNEIDKFNNAISIYSEKQKNGRGEEVAVDTLYVGLGAAYFVSESGDLAGTGSPGANGWEWSVQPELAASVRNAVRVYRNERSAQFIPLPVVIH